MHALKLYGFQGVKPGGYVLIADFGPTRVHTEARAHELDSIPAAGAHACRLLSAGNRLLAECCLCFGGLSRDCGPKVLGQTFDIGCTENALLAAAAERVDAAFTDP